MNVRMAGCRACEQITSGDCGMHGPLFIPSGVVAGAAPAQEPSRFAEELKAVWNRLPEEYHYPEMLAVIDALAATSAGAAPEPMTELHESYMRIRGQFEPWGVYDTNFGGATSFIKTEAALDQVLKERTQGVFYVMVDRPSIKCGASRQVRHTNKPRHEHRTLESATTEAARLAKRTQARALVLKVVATVPAPPKVSVG